MKYNPDWKKYYLSSKPQISHSYSQILRQNILTVVEKNVTEVNDDFVVWGEFEKLIDQIETTFCCIYKLTLSEEPTKPTVELIEKIDQISEVLKNIKKLSTNSYEPSIEVQYFEKPNFITFSFPSRWMRDQYQKVLVWGCKELSFSSEDKEFLIRTSSINGDVFFDNKNNKQERCVYPLPFLTEEGRADLCVTAFRTHSYSYTVLLAFNNPTILENLYSMFKFINGFNIYENERSQEVVVFKQCKYKNRDFLYINSSYLFPKFENKQKLKLKMPANWREELAAKEKKIEREASQEFQEISSCLDRNKSKNGSLISELIIIIYEYYYNNNNRPTILLYKALKNDFIGMVFSSELSRTYFKNLFKDLGTEFSEAEKKAAQRLEPTLFKLNNRNANCMVNFEHKTTVYIPAFVRGYYIYAVFKSMEYAKRFQELVLEDNLERSTFTMGNNSCIMFKKVKHLFEPGSNIKLLGNYQEPDDLKGYSA